MEHWSMVSFAINNTLCDTPSQIAPTVTSHVSATRAAYISYMLDFKSLSFFSQIQSQCIE